MPEDIVSSMKEIAEKEVEEKRQLLHIIKEKEKKGLSPFDNLLSLAKLLYLLYRFQQYALQKTEFQ